MKISSSLASRLGPGGPARWSPYARPSDPSRGGSVPNTSRPPLRLGPARKEALAPSRSSCRPEATAASDAADPKSRLRGCDKPNPKPKTNQNSKSAGRKREEEPSVQEKHSGGRDGGGGFAFLCALAGHTEPISGISLPLGSDKLYSGSSDGSVRLWDCNSGKCVDVIKMGGKIGCMITHGPWVFVGISKSVEACNSHTGMKFSLHGPSGLVCSMTLKDGMLFAGSGDGRIIAWKFPDEKSDFGPVAILSGHERPVISLSVSATRLYSGSLDKTIKVWDLKTLQCVQTLCDHKAAVTSVLCWDEKLLSCSLDKTIKIWAASKSGDLQAIYTHAEEHVIPTSSTNYYTSFSSPRFSLQFQT
ncbi:hypothetical protein GUJ93_ZPchr0008g13381 [Zizania palustris]|uniref:Uncharacterized protein n=1 Tax=Zizania palustris TaxID=103762 RepID=A0A8J5V125_ZIZPA|nr:hypothetical protein GUJ93_ZPchr0008g13381 [Zizania palustris]